MCSVTSTRCLACSGDRIVCILETWFDQCFREVERVYSRMVIFKSAVCLARESAMSRTNLNTAFYTVPGK